MIFYEIFWSAWLTPNGLLMSGGIIVVITAR